MRETSHSFPDILAPGTVIELDDITQLPTFEDFVASEVDPNYNPELWAGRLALCDLIRPPKFNGTIVDIRLQVMPEPYERLLDSKERGWHASAGANYRLTSEFADELIPRYRGFAMVADAKSSGRGVVGQIQAELYYYPLPLYRQNHKAGSTIKHKYNRKTTGEVVEYISVVRHDNSRVVKQDSYGQAIRRVVMKPRLDSEKFIELDEAVRRIGISVLRQSLARPISTPMRD